MEILEINGHRLSYADTGSGQPLVFVHGVGTSGELWADELGIEFVLDVAPASRKPALVTARAQKHGAIHHDDVSVVAASSV